MRYMLNLKFNKKIAFFGLLVLNAKAIGSFIADQQNISKVEMPTFDDPCNKGGSIYVSCQNTTKGLPYSEFTDCMEKIGRYNSRQGDQCCPVPDPVQFVDCEPTPPPTSPPSISSSSGITWWEAVLIATGAASVIGTGVYCCITKCSMLARLARNAQQQEQAEQLINPAQNNAQQAAPNANVNMQLV